MGKFATGTLGLILMLTVGCASPNTANLIEIVPEGTAKIQIKNPGLHDDVEIVSGRALYEDDILLAVVELRSHTSNKENLEYRFTWRDADDAVLEKESWSGLFVNGLEEQQVQGRATEPNAVRSFFELRRFSGRTNAN